MSYPDLYSQIQSLESVFTLPIPYVTVDVGTFDASTGQLGRATVSETDPEPMEHLGGQHPVNAPLHFSGNFWVHNKMYDDLLLAVVYGPALFTQPGRVPVLNLSVS